VNAIFKDAARLGEWLGAGAVGRLPDCHRFVPMKGNNSRPCVQTLAH
jgi:hypothetical protein